MAKIRHIGTTTRDPAATAAFFVQAFGMTEVERSPSSEGIILSDGYIGLPPATTPQTAKQPS